MPISIIPVTGLLLGPIGSISQTDFPLISPRGVNDTDTNPIAFGETFVLNANNTDSSVKQFISSQGVAAFINLMTQGFGPSLTPNQFPTTAYAIGIAKDSVLTNTFYSLQGGTNMPAGSYVPGMMVNGLTRGTISVQVNNGTPSRAGSPIYVRTFVNPAIPAGVVGGVEAVNDPTTAMFASANHGNHGSGEISGLSLLAVSPATAFSVMGNYVISFTSSTTFTVTNPQGELMGVGSVGTTFSTGSTISFLLSAGSVPFQAGDAFTVTAITIMTLQINNICFKTGILSTDPNTGVSASQVTILERKLV